MTEKTYAEGRARLEESLRRLAEVAERRGSAAVAESTHSLRRKLADQRFNVVVAGEFKRGKTTFVNALLGAEVLPAAVVPLTSIVTAVTWGERPRAEVRFLDGRTQGVLPEDLAHYVTERENPRNEMNVDRAFLFYPSDQLRDGVFLVDTPGVGSVYAHNTDAAYAFVPEADVAIFLTSADPPISEGERRFLSDVRAEAARMFFVLNKIDYLSQSDLAEAVEFTRGVLRDALGHEPPVYPVSARRALAGKLAGDHPAVEKAGLSRFERDFRRFLLREKGQVILDSTAAQARKLVLDELNSVDVQAGSLAIPEERLAKAAEEMEAVFAEAIRSRDDIRTLLQRAIAELVATVEADLAALQDGETPRLLAEAERELVERDDLRSAGAELDRWIKERIRHAIDRWRGEEEHRVATAFSTSTARFVDETNRLVERTVRLCADLLRMELSAAAPPSGISPEIRFSFSFTEEMTFLESVLPDMRGFLPGTMARKLFLKELREKVPALVDKHCGRLRWDFVQRLERSRTALERDLDGRLDATIQSLRLGVRRAMEDRARSAEEARASERQLADVRSELMALAGALEPRGADGAAAEGPAA